MILRDHFRLAKTSLKATRGRTALTILGIVIGIASICLVLGFGEGAKQAVRNQVLSIGQNMITIRPGKAERNPIGSITSYTFANLPSTTTLTEFDLEVVDLSPGTDHTAPLMILPGSIKNGNRQANNAPIVATTSQFNEVFEAKIKEGQFLEEDLSRNVAVVGYNLAIDLFGTDLALGNQMQVRGQTFTVIGVLDKTEQPNALAGFDFNNAIYISLDAGKSFHHGSAQIQQIVVRVSNADEVSQAADNVFKALLKNHDNEEDFSVIQAADALAVTDNVFSVLIAAITAIASISLIVGGVGIMNIMLVTVAERTREIGIRKAVGATRRQILSQFLVEASVMSLVGGIIGLLIAIIIGFIAGLFLPVAPIFTWQVILSAVAVALVAGVVFGIYPALKAARKKPIDALKHVD